MIGLHALRNAMITVITVIGLQGGALLGGAILTETIFSWPGMGKLIIDSINTLDRPMIVAYLMVTVLMFVTINFIVDVIYTVLDPRVKIGSLAR